MAVLLSKQMNEMGFFCQKVVTHEPLEVPSKVPDCVLNDENLRSNIFLKSSLTTSEKSSFSTDLFFSSSCSFLSMSITGNFTFSTFLEAIISLTSSPKSDSSEPFLVARLGSSTWTQTFSDKKYNSHHARVYPHHRSWFSTTKGLDFGEMARDRFIMIT